LIYKHGKIKVPHFAHEKDNTCDYIYHENETNEHIKGKVFLYDWVKKIPEVTYSKLEAWLPDTKQKPDIYFEIGATKYVIEYQCTPITIDEFNTRHGLYELSDINDIWFFGFDKYNIKSDNTYKPKILQEILINRAGSVLHLNTETNLIKKFHKKSNFDLKYYCKIIDLKQHKVQIQNNDIVVINENKFTEAYKHNTYYENKRNSGFLLDDNKYKISRIIK
jgi:competence CoiA-like predicted nuclease